jgi:ABC-type antimicrobial peptide transport system permease subunit
MFKIAFSQFKYDRRRLLPFILSIALASAVLAILMFSLYAQHLGMIDMAIGYSGKQHFVINEALTDEQLTALKGTSGVNDVWTSDEFTYVAVSDISKTYQVAETAASAMGLERNAYGQFKITFNRQLLGLYGVKDPYYGGITALGQYLLAMAGAAVLVMLLFVVMIRGAYAQVVRENMRRSGMLLSVGMTPRQLSQMLLLETVICFATAAIAGVIAGYGVQALIYSFSFSAPLTAAVILCSFITVLIAVYGQLRKLMRVSIVSAINGSIYDSTAVMQYKKANEPISPKSPSRSLAGCFYRANRKGSRAAVADLALFCAVGISFQLLMAAVRANSYLELENKRFSVSMSFAGGLPSGETIDRLENLADDHAAYYANTCCVMSDIDINDESAINIWFYNGRPMLHTVIYGMDQSTFEKFKSQRGIDADGAVLIKNIAGSSGDAFSGIFPLNDISSVTLSARSAYDIENERTAVVPIAAVTDVYPDLGDVYFKYFLVIVIGIDEFLSYDEALYGDQSLRSANLSLNLPEDEIEACTQKIAEIMQDSDTEIAWYNTLINDKQAVEENIRPIEQFFYILILFFGLLGLINALNSIRASLESRRRDFELLRSTGLDERQELGIYLWEAAFFSAAPILAAIPVAVVMLIVLKAFLFKALPVSGWLGRLSPLLLLSAALPWMAVVFATYCFGGRRMKG